MTGAQRAGADDPLSEPTISTRFFRSAGAATFSQVWRVFVTFGITLVLRRWIAPGDYGLFEWSLVIFMVLGGVRDLGLVYHVVRLKRRPYGNLLALEVVWGALVALAVCLGADVLARAFSADNPNVVGVLRAMSAFLFFEGLASVPRTYFDAELEVGRTVVPEILRNLLFAATSVTLALLGFGVWSLVIAQVVSTALYAAHLWLRAWGRMTLTFDRDGWGALLLHSLPLGSIWVLIVLTRHVDPLILALRFEDEVVGNYTFAYFLAFLVATYLVPAVTRALYPALVAFRAEPEKLLGAYRLATLFVLALEAPVAYFLFFNPELVVQLVGGGKWLEAPVYLRILCFAPLIDPFTRLGGEILKVYHRDRLWILSSAFTLVSFVVAGWLLTSRMGPVGMAWANYLPLGGIVFMTWGVYRIAPAPFRRLVGDVVLIYLVPLLPFALAVWASADQPRLRFALSMAAGLVALAAYARRYGREFRGFFRTPSVARRDA